MLCRGDCGGETLKVGVEHALSNSSWGLTLMRTSVSRTNCANMCGLGESPEAECTSLGCPVVFPFGHSGRPGTKRAAGHLCRPETSKPLIHKHHPHCRNPFQCVLSCGRMWAAHTEEWCSVRLPWIRKRRTFPLCLLALSYVFRRKAPWNRT